MKQLRDSLIKAAIAALTTITVVPGMAAGPEDLEPEMTAWFRRGLSGRSANIFSPDIRLKATEVDNASAAVWKSWRAANNAFDEQKLPEIAPLADSGSTYWAIPASLEPDATMAFYFGSKGNPIPEAGLPLFIYTHGSGPREREWATGLKICSAFDDAPSLYFIPRIPNTGEYYRWWQQGKQWIWEKLLRQALSSESIDPDRIYIFGISEGGYGSQRLASFYADYLAGAGPMAGGEPLRNAPAENCRNIAFSLRTGDRDTGFYRDKLTGYVSEAFDSLAAASPDDFNHRIELIPGAGHHIDYSPTTPWLKTHTRNPWPKRVSWEDFEMDGRHRTGFYNIRVTDAPHNYDDSTDRTRYEMRIENNHIDISVHLVDYTTTETDERWGIALKFNRSYRPAVNGAFTIYLNDKLVDLSQPVTVTVNGRQRFKGKLTLKLDNLIESCAEFGDPRRLYPAAVDIRL